jgi:site-specific DNA-methyltransferase (adenine-specific)
MKRKREELEELSKKKMEITNKSLLTVNGGIKRSIIYADPPWQYTISNISKKNGHAENHYNTMTIEELKQLKVSEIANDDSILLLWTNGPQMKNSLKLMKAWGYKYTTLFAIWVKTDKNGNLKGKRLGYYTRQLSEVVLLGTRGKVLKYKKEKCPFVPNTFLEQSYEHSRKPERVREMIEEIFKNVPKIELFARTSNYLRWDAWGDQTQKFGESEFKDSEILKERLKQLSNVDECKKLKFRGTKKIITEEEEEEE